MVASSAKFSASNPINLANRLADVTDGTSNSILLGECGGREDVWRRSSFYPVNYTGPPKVRARGGAWATTDNAYDIGQRKAWDKLRSHTWHRGNQQLQ